MITGIMSESLHIKGIMSKEFSAIRCLDFNGSTDWVNIPDDNSLDLGTNDFSIELWLKLNSVSIAQAIFVKYTSMANPGIRIGFLTAGTKLQAFFGGTGDHPSVFSNALSIHTWYNCILVADRSENGIWYVNTVAGNPYNISGTTTITNDEPLIIAKVFGTWAWFDGLIGVLRIYKNKLLNATERQNNFNGKITQDGLVAEWLMREQQGNMLHDSVGSNHGTIYGADWYEEKFNTPLRGTMSNSSKITGTMTAEYI